jgi:transposase-like protein
MKKKHNGTQIVAKLRQADVLIGQGKSIPEVCREIEVSEQTYYRWRQKYGGMSPEMVKELRGLQKENARLRKVVADQALENAILREVASKNGWSRLLAARPSRRSWGSWESVSGRRPGPWGRIVRPSGMS